MGTSIYTKSLVLRMICIVVTTRALLGKTVFRMNIFVTSDVFFYKFSRSFGKKIVSLYLLVEFGDSEYEE